MQKLHFQFGYFICVLFIISLFSCKKDGNNISNKAESPFPIKLKSLSPEKTGVDFVQTLVDDGTLHFFIWNALYQGAGVAIGDLDNDGLPDIYFCGNQVKDRLYKNMGNFKFKEMPLPIPQRDKTWSTGVTMADVNGDGYLDIYVCKNSFFAIEQVTQNKLYLNKGNFTFVESADKFGIADAGFSFQASFFDADNDNDLDLYVVNQPIDQFAQLVNPPDKVKSFSSTDRFYLNTGNTFIDATDQLRFKNYAFGLNVLTTDIDNDGWKDIYVSNDYHYGDLLYHNKGKLLFKDELSERFDHGSFYSMGADVADINNDGWQDIFTLDMAFADHYRAKTNMKSMDIDRFWEIVAESNQYQYPQNMLQINNGFGNYTEVAQVAGLSKTDWSWAALFADLNNNGKKDLLVTNGVMRDMQNNDFNNFVAENYDQGIPPEKIKEVLGKLPSVPVTNYLFENQGDLKFNSIGEVAGFDHKGFSQGAAYGDLDGDGDLDIVLNNMDAPAMIYENDSKTGNYLTISCTGPEKNTFGQGARVEIYYNDNKQVTEILSSRGYLSSVEPKAFFGLGNLTQVDSVIVFWDHQFRTKTIAPKINQELTVDYNERETYQRNETLHKPMFERVGLLDYFHEEALFDDFKDQVLLPYKLSELGPAINSGDLNGDGLSDIYITGNNRTDAGLYFQTTDGKFEKKRNSATGDTNGEALDVLFFDSNGNGYTDIYIASGSNEYEEGSSELGHRLLINDGESNFREIIGSLPDIRLNSEVVRDIDVDNDGDLDLFVGGRMVSGQYPLSPESKILINNEGIFEDQSDDWLPDEGEIGMVTDASILDIDDDGDKDIIVVGEWTPITILYNDGDKFRRDEVKMNDQSSRSLWWTISAGDMDNDGDIDFLCGNLGKNNKFLPKPSNPLSIFASDFDENGDHDVVLGKGSGENIKPVRGLECSSEEMPFLLDKYGKYHDYASANLSDMINIETGENVVHYQTTFLESIYLENTGNGQFISHELPLQCQLGPIKDFLIKDFNNDGFLDFVFAGNHYSTEVETVRYDANKGGLCLGDGKGNFEFVPSAKSGVFIDCDARDLELVESANSMSYILVTCNQDSLMCFQINGYEF